LGIFHLRHGGCDLAVQLAFILKAIVMTPKFTAFRRSASMNRLATATAILTAALMVGFSHDALASVYQRAVLGSCVGTACSAAAPAVPAGKTLTVQTIACKAAFGTPGATGTGSLYRADDPAGFMQRFLVSEVAGSTTVALTQSVPFTFAAGKVPSVRIDFAAGTPQAISCSLRGTLAP
jgi:hypothetical protein